MASITLKGNPINTIGDLPAVGSQAPHFSLTAKDLSEVGLDAYAGKKKIVSIVPSLDTGVCATSAQKFNEKISSLDGVVLLNVSGDLPFAAARFCDSHSLKNIVTLSTFRSPMFGKDYGVEIIDGPLRGLTARAVLVLDENNTVLYSELVPEIVQEPDYDAALAAL